MSEPCNKPTINLQGMLENMLFNAESDGNPVSQWTCGTCANGEECGIYCRITKETHPKTYLCNGLPRDYQPRTDTRDFDKLAEVAQYMLYYIRDMNNPHTVTRFDATEHFEKQLRDCGVEA